VRAALILVAMMLLMAVRGEAQMPAVYVEEIEPPDSWEAIYHEVEDCVGMKKGKYKDIRWFVSKAPWGQGRNRTWGLWHASGGEVRIIVAAYDTAVVRHEALHDVLHRNGFKPFRIPADSSTNPEHPSPPFGTCAKRWFP
jgi:hypothetical protein